MKKTVNGWLTLTPKGFIQFAEGELPPQWLGGAVNIWVSESYWIALPSLFVPEGLTFENSPKRCTMTIDIED